LFSAAYPNNNKKTLKIKDLQIVCGITNDYKNIIKSGGPDEYKINSVKRNKLHKR
jgi:hypothetical protein